MNNKSGLNLAEMFSDASQGQEVLELETKVLNLTHEIQELKQRGQDDHACIKKLKEELATSIQEIPLSLINRNEKQPRQTFLAKTIRTLAESLQREGQQEPIMVMEKENGSFMEKEDGSSYEIFDGERRYRAAKRLEWDTIKAIIVPEPEKLQRKLLVASLHREGLNQLDMTEAVIKEINAVTNLEPSVIVRSLKAVVRRFNNHIDDLSLTNLEKIPDVEDIKEAPTTKQRGRPKLEGISASERQILKVLLELGINPASFSVTVACLNLFDDLKSAIRERGLSVNFAFVLQKLSADELQCTPNAALKARARLIEEIEQKNLPLSKVRQMVAQKLKKSPSHEPKQTKWLKTFSQIKISQLSSSEREQLKQVLLQKLQELGG